MSKYNQSILFLSSWYPNRTNPTLGNFNEKFAESVAFYNKVTAIHIVSDSEMTQDYELKYSINNNVKTYIGYFKKVKNENFLNKIFKYFNYYKYYFKVYKKAVKDEGEFDLIHLNILFPVGIIALFFKWFYKLPYVISENWTGYLPSNEVKQSFFIRLISRIIAKNATYLLPVTDNLKQAMIKKGFENNYIIVPNVTDIKYFYLPKTYGPKEKKVILHVSSLKDDHKNITGIIDVIKRLTLVRTDFELIIVGDGDATQHILYAKKNELYNNVIKFRGAMTPEEIGNIMRESDMFLMFSNYENLPCVIVEAFAAGLPVVSSTAGGISEHLSADKGVLVEPKDEEALYNAINNVLDNLKSYNKNILHNYAVDNFSYESVGKKLSEIYFSIIKT